MRATNNEGEFSCPCRFSSNLRITVAANQGGRRYMEDRVHIDLVRSAEESKGYVYVGVYDGHGGADASEFVRKNLLKNIQKQEGFNQTDEEMLEAIKKGFIETHYEMWKVVGAWPLTASGYTSTAGTTASVAFITRGKLFTGHVGDSAIILGKKQDNEVMGVCMTVDHKPDNSFEEQRINRAGGMVMRKSGVMRVVWTRPLKGHIGPIRRSTPTESIAFLAVARSLGDLWSYNKETKQFIVSPEPDVSVYILDETDMCLVLGSDGLTNVLKPQQIVEIVNNCEDATDLMNGKLVNHSKILLHHALKGWGSLRADNITVITVLFDNAERDELSNPLYERCSDNSFYGMDLDQLFTENQTALARITSECCQTFSTVPIEIVYTDIGYSGPGFSKQVVRDNPILPSKNPTVFTLLKRSASCSAVLREDGDKRDYSSLVDFTNESTPDQDVPSSSQTCCSDGLTEHKQEVGNESSAQPEACLSCTSPVTESTTENISQTVIDGCKSDFCLQEDTKLFSETDVSSCQITADNDGKVAENVTTLASETPEGSSFFSTTPPNKNLQESMYDRAYVSPILKPVAVVSPFETTPTSSGRRRLIPLRRRTTSFRRRGAARRNLMSSDEFSSHEKKEYASSFSNLKSGDSKENGDFWLQHSVLGSNDTVKHEKKVSLGSASALSPMLMLAALRTPDQLMLHKGENDPLRKELASFRYTKYRSPMLLNATPKLEKLKLNDETVIQTGCTPISTQKRRVEIDGNVHASSEPAPKRSRLWNFFSNLLGGDRAHK